MEQLAKDSTSASLKITSTEAPAIVGSSAWEFSLGINLFHASTDEGLFSSSLPVLPHEKLNFSDAESYGQSFDDSSPSVNKLHLDDSGNDFLEESFLPDDEDELLAGIADDFDLSGLPSKLEDMGEYDVFGSGGGMELDSDPQDGLNIGLAKIKLSDGYVGNETGHYGLPNGMGTVTGEHPYGEHPSRTLFVRNINSNVEDSELKALFEQYGDIRTLYTACKHRGFVMISYYDIRDARAAMRTLQNKPLRRRKLDIHFSIPKDNPSEKDINQGTLVVFNLDPSVSNDDLRQIFGAYGEIKEIRETPHKRHHKFIEFYDVRAAEAALKALNRSDIAGKRIKLEPSRPGGARRSLMQQLTQELEHDDGRSFRHSVGSPVANSPPGNWTKFGSPLEKNLLQSFSQSQDLGARSSNHMPGLASILTPHASSSVKVPSSGKDQEFADFTPTSRAPCQYSHSLPQQKSCVAPGPVSYSRELNSNASAVGSLTGPQFLWGSPAYSDHAKSSAWPASSPGHQIASSGRGQGFPYSSSHSSSFLGSYPHYHVGSAPSGVPFDRQLSYLSESPEPTFIPVAYGGMGLSHSGRNYLRNTGSHANINAGVAFPGHGEENCSPVLRMMSLPRHGSMFLGNGSFPGQRVSNIEGFSERSRHRMENNGSQTDGKNQYQLNLDKISSGEDTRTTLMIKNIPNKYTSKMLLAAIDENHGGAYDFVYLPIDFKNKCNVGYAFINMVSPLHIISFYEAFNGKKWEKFNSEKVASLAYARIQGKAALVAHFQNSSLMNEDKRCRPILFHSESLETHDQEEPLATGNLNVCIRQPDGSYSGDSLDCPMGNLDEIPKKDQLRT